MMSILQIIHCVGNFGFALKYSQWCNHGESVRGFSPPPLENLLKNT